MHESNFIQLSMRTSKNNFLFVYIIMPIHIAYLSIMNDNANLATKMCLHS